jgi:hypothetical protein
MILIHAFFIPYSPQLLLGVDNTTSTHTHLDMVMNISMYGLQVVLLQVGMSTSSTLEG